MHRSLLVATGEWVMGESVAMMVVLLPAISKDVRKNEQLTIRSYFIGQWLVVKRRMFGKTRMRKM